MKRAFRLRRADDLCIWNNTGHRTSEAGAYLIMLQLRKQLFGEEQRRQEARLSLLMSQYDKVRPCRQDRKRIDRKEKLGG